MIELTCSQCGEHIELPESLAGDLEECPVCRNALVVPTMTRGSVPQARLANNDAILAAVSAPPQPVVVAPNRNLMSPSIAIRRFAAGGLCWLFSVLGFLLLGAMWASLSILFEEMGWPAWIVWVVVVFAFLGIDGLFYLTYTIAIIAGFFYSGVWRWSLAAIGVIVLGHLLFWGIVAAVGAITPQDYP